MKNNKYYIINKKEDKKNSVNKTIYTGFLWLLTLIFITLKLTGYIDWSWLWILSPIWIPIGIALFIFLTCAIILGIVTIYETSEKKNK